MDNKTPSLNELNSLGIFSGRISEVHIKNLEVFPFIYFNGVTKAEIDYDVAQAKDKASYIHYDLTIHEENDMLEKRFEGLEKAVRALFWKEMSLKVSFKGLEMYHSE